MRIDEAPIDSAPPPPEADDANPHELSDQELAELFGDAYAEEARGTWAVQSLEDADWALQRLGDLHSEILENKKVQEAAILRIKLRTEQLNQRIQRGIEFFTAKLAEYAETHKAELLKGGRKKSRALVHGTIGWAKKGGGLKVADESRLLDWCRAQPVELGVLRIKEEPALKEIAAHAKATGEVPDGAEIAEGRDELQIKPLSIWNGEADE